MVPRRRITRASRPMTSASALSSQAAASSMLATAAVASLFCISTKSRERATAVSRINAASLSLAAGCQPVWVTFGLRTSWRPLNMAELL